MEVKEKVDDILNKLKWLEDVRKPWETEWQDIADYVRPQRAVFDWSKDRKGERTGTKIYDSVGQDSNKLRAEGLQGYVTSAASAWFKLGFEDDNISELPGARLWIQEVEKKFYQIFRESNFYKAIYDMFLDSGAFGTAVMYIELVVATGKVKFSTRHLKEIYISEDKYQIPDTIMRRFYMSAMDLIKTFGEEKFDEGFLERAKNKPYEMHKVVHAVFPREDRDFYKIDQINKPFASIYILEDERLLLREGGYDDNPYVILREGKNPDEVYGRGPSHDALPEILRAQQIARTSMRARQKAVDPPVTYPKELMGILDLDPAGENPVSPGAGKVEPINQGQYYPAGTEQEQMIRQSIREKYNVDFWLMLNSMVGKNLTATQVLEMQSEKAAVLGTLLGLINDQLLDPLFDRVFSICYKAGKFPPPPPALAETGAKIKVSYIGPLAQKQKQFHAVYGLQQALGQYLPLIQIDPSIKDVVDWEETARYVLESGGAPEKIIRDKKTVKAIQEKRAQLQEMMMQQQQGQNIADLYQKTQKAPEKGSGAEALAGALSEQ